MEREGLQPKDVAHPTPTTRGVFYPPSPDVPRLQFLTSFSKSTDLGPTSKKEIGRFEKFVLGEEQEEAADTILKPYGIAIDRDKLYVCDVQKRLVEVLDFKKKTFDYLSRERRMSNPVNLCVVDGVKYVADPTAGQIFVFGTDNELKTILGGGLGLKPIDVGVRGRKCYVTDMKSGQVVVLDVGTGNVLTRMGKAGDDPGQFVLIGDIALDGDENVYVSDKFLGRVTQFDKTGLFKKAFGQVGDSIHHFVRPKGLDVDHEGRIWIVDAAPEVAKVYDAEGRLLMYFGLPGSNPGSMNLPASILVDYDHVDLFRAYVTEGAEIEFLVFVSNQYGEKINVYGFGHFPVQERAIQEAKLASAAEVLTPGEKRLPSSPRSLPKPDSRSADSESTRDAAAAGPPPKRMEDIANLYYRSMHLYRNGQYGQARPGFIEVLNSGLIPPPMEETIRSVLSEIDRRTPNQPGPGRP